MPFLRAALIKKQAPAPEAEEEIVIQPVAPAPVPVIPDDLEQELGEPEIGEVSQEEIIEPDKSEENSLPEEAPEIPVIQEAEPEIETETLPLENQVEIEEEIIEFEPVTEPEPEEAPAEAQETEIEETSAEPEPEIKKDVPPEMNPEDIPLQYDFDSDERYVDKVSTKTDFDRMLDELAAISKDQLSWEAEKFAKKFADKFQGSDEKKYEAFLGGYITNAAMTLYDKGYHDAAIKQLDQAKSILAARQKLEKETAEIKDRVAEEGAAVDLSDILGMFGDG